MPSSAAVTPPPTLTVWFDGPVPVLQLPDRLAFDPMRRWLRSVIPGRLDLLGGRTARLDFGERELVLFDVRRLVHGLEEEFGITITGLYLSDETVLRFAQRELRLKLFLHGAPDSEGHDGTATTFDRWADAREADTASPTPAPPRSVRSQPGLRRIPPVHEAPPRGPIAPRSGRPRRDGAMSAVAVTPPEVRERRVDELDRSVVPAGSRAVLVAPSHKDARPCLPVFRTLRSGAQIRFDGDVYVYGDVNPGAQVVATGNIAVMGTLKGVAHAGAHGDESTFILAFSMRPTQLRIGRHLFVDPVEHVADARAELATVRDQRIRVRPYTGRINP